MTGFAATLSSVPIRVVLIDDEIEACENLTNIFRKYVPYPIEIVGVFYNTLDLEPKLAVLKPDAVFIDIEMPDENAFQFLERIVRVDFEIIFVTAYDEYAIKAFKINALDYILKPISIDELNTAVQKLQTKLWNDRLLKDPEFFRNFSREFREKNAGEMIHLRTQNSLEIIAQRDIISIEAKGNYSKIGYQVKGQEKSIIVSNAISYYEDILPADCFFRIHKSFLVNCLFLRHFTLEPLAVTLKNNYVFPVSRRRYNQLLQFLKEHNYHQNLGI
jgi:two-component system, LytTR family, response regulator